MLQILIKTDKVVPTDVVSSVYDISYKKLYDSGITQILIDLDNTLITYQEHTANDAVKSLFQELISIGFSLCIVSNSGTHRVMPVASVLNVPYVAYAKKPFKTGLKKALQMLDAKPETSIMIGDQLMTDVFAARRLGMSVILVKPLKRKTEKWYTKLNRKIENIMLNKMAKSHPDTHQKIIEMARDNHV